MATVHGVALVALYFSHLAVSQDCADEFTIRPMDVVVSAGEVALMRCEYTPSSDDIDPVIQWERGGTTVVAEDSPCDCEVTVEGTLRFHNVTANDAGDYKCFVLVGHGQTVDCPATLRLAEAPVISNMIGPGFATSTRRELSVIVTGDPVPDVEWRHNGNLVSETERISLSSEVAGGGKRETLIITNIKPEDRGVYTLHASNTAGQADDVQWTVPVLFGTVSVREDTMSSGTRLTCTGEYYSLGEANIMWIRADTSVAASGEETVRGTYQTSFESFLDVPTSSCRGVSEVVKCQLNRDGVGGEDVRTSASINICVDNCTPPTVEATVDNCSDLKVTLTGQLDNYMIEYQPQGSTQLSRTPANMHTSPQTFTVTNVMENTVYDIRATCRNASSDPGNFISVATSSKPPPVTSVLTELIYNSSGTFSMLTWEPSSAADVTGYLITWSFDDMETQELTLPHTTTQYDWSISCDVSYVYQVEAVNPCGQGPPSAAVQQMCGEPPPLRVELHTLSYSTSETSLTLMFTINHIQLVKSVRVDILEQDDDFVTLQTLNYTITEDTYKDGSVCLTGLTPGVQYLVCLRVDYRDIGEDSTCSRLVREREDTAQGSCQLPTSIRRVTAPDDTSSPPAIPDWGIAVIVVGALLLVAFLFCFLGLCFACQSSQSKNVNFGSTSSINTERGGNVVPTSLHMSNPRTMSPTRSCLKYHRGHSTTWNDHVDTLRQMETDKGTHV